MKYITYNGKRLLFDNKSISIKGQNSIILDSLELYLDASNSLSYPGSGNDWFDIINDNNATLIGTPTFDTNSILLDSSEYGTTNFTINYINDWTVQIVFKRLISSYWQPLWACEVWSSNLGYLLYFTDSTTLAISRGGQFPTPSVEVDLTGYVTSNFILYTTIKKTDGTFQIWVNDNLIKSSTIDNVNITKPLVFGTRYGNNGSGYSDTRGGGFGNLLVYSKSLTSQEILNNYNIFKNTWNL